MTLSRLFPLLLITSALACRSKETPAPAPEAKPKGAEAKPKGAEPPSSDALPKAQKEAAAPPEAKPQVPPAGSLELIGPALWITPGKGIGSIFFGAFEETVAQKMEAPCDLTKTETADGKSAPGTKKLCAYVDRGVLFTFEEGVLSGIHIQRRDREVRGFDLKEPRHYGTYKGGVPPNTVIGLHKHIVEEEYGKPKKEEKLKATGPGGLVALGHYPGVTFEYDKLENGNTVLSGFVIEPDAQSKKVIETVKKTKRDASGG